MKKTKVNIKMFEENNKNYSKEEKNKLKANGIIVVEKKINRVKKHIHKEAVKWKKEKKMFR